MTVALILADQANAGLRGQLTALGVRRVDVTDRAGPALLSVAAAAQVAGERVLICAGDGTVPEEILARLLRAGGTAAFTRTGPARWWWAPETWGRWPGPPEHPRRPPPSARSSRNCAGAASGSACSTAGPTATARSPGSLTRSPPRPPGGWPGAS